MSEQIELPIEIPKVTPEGIYSTSEQFPVDIEPNTPTKIPRRNKYGLLVDSKYIFKEDGMIDWKASVDPKFLYINPDQKRRNKLETKYGKKFEEIKIVEDKVDDADLTISLGGIKQLLRLRGYTSVHYLIHEATDHYAGVNCVIYFLPSYESENKEIRFSDNACAHLDNTGGFGKSYLLEIATNRAFCRTIRNFLGIQIVSQDELGGNSNGASEPVEDMATTLLKDTMAQHGVTWEKIQAKLVEEKLDGAENFKGVQDIPRVKIFELVSRIKTKAAEKSAEKK